MSSFRAPTLNDAIVLAAYSHNGQKDKSGEPYILHCLRVMLAFQDDKHRIVAVLHDVVEDTHITFERLQRVEHYSKPILAALEAITRREGERYFEYIRRCGENPIARAVKIADLRDNTSPIRAKNLPAGEYKGLLKRYEKALSLLENDA